MSAPREVCYACLKPRVVCVCATLPRVRHRTEVLVLQHPKERFHPLGTVRLLERALERVQVQTAWQLSLPEPRLPFTLGAHAAVLYPARGARPLETLPPEQRPEQLIVLDGTWHHAKTLYRDYRQLHALPHLGFSPPEPSRYRIRREPAEHCVSTVEAVIHALGLLEPEATELGALGRAFDAMIDAQLRYIDAGAGQRRGLAKQRPSAVRRLPHGLVERWSELVVVHAELWGEAPGGRQVLQLVAERPSSGERFQGFAAPSAPLSALQLALLELDAEQLHGSAEALRERFGDFVAGGVVSAWHEHVARAVTGPLGRGGFALKGVYRRRRPGATGRLEEALAAEALELRPNGLAGRAARRLAAAVSVARWLRRDAGVAPG